MFATLEARAAALGAPVGEVLAKALTPMMCERSGGVLAAPGWIYELKLDGVRILADVRGDDVRLLYRKSRDASASYPEVAEALARWGAPRLVLDGEIVTFDEHGRPSFELLGRRIGYSRAADVRLARKSVPVVYVVFDLLAIGARDLRGLPLSARKELLRAVAPKEPLARVRVLEHLTDDGRPLFDLCKKEKLEGLVAKRAASPYRAGVRSADWVKVKCETDDEFVVVGFTEDKNGGMGALDLATYDGDALVVRGEVGSGLDRRVAAELAGRFAKLVADVPTARGEYERDATRRHVRPEIVVSVRYLAWSLSGRLRMPVFRGVRDDVDPTECVAAPEAARPMDFERPQERDAARVAYVVKSRSKALWAGADFTRGDLADYYDAVFDALQPHLADRPVVLARPPKRPPSWLRLIGPRACVIDHRDALRFLVSEGAIALDVLGSRASTPNDGDWLALELRADDPRALAAAALSARDVLCGLGLAPHVKTAAGALHVMAALGGAAWEPRRALATLVARLVETRCGSDARVAPAADGPLATLSAPYSALDRGVVSVPLAWDELAADLEPAHWTLATVPARLAARGDPMRAIVGERGELDEVVRRVQELVAKERG